MRFENYILNEGRSKTITEEQVIEMLSAYCSKAVKTYASSPIYRGVNNRDDYLYISPNPLKPRKSANTANFYTLIMNNAPKWKKYPKRQIICSTNSNTTVGYSIKGNSFQVFPYDGAKIGVCPTDDIWNSFNNNLDDLNMDINTLFEYFNVYGIDNIKTYKQLINAFKKLTLPKISDDVWSDDLAYQLNDIDPFILKPYNTLYDWAMEFYDPNKNGFKVVKVGSKLPTGDNEAWLDSKCVMIREKRMGYIMEKL